jgi:hypothetical protein
MIKGKNAKRIRKWHRYLGLILGIQFIMWTVSGIYFSWTNIDEIHGDHLKNLEYEPGHFNNLFPINQLDIPAGIQEIELREIGETPHYWVNDEALFNAFTGEKRNGISQEEALLVAKARVLPHLKIQDITLITETDAYHEYREKLLPAYVIAFEHPDKVKAYVSFADGKFQTVRHEDWRWFDFLWMTHTMDYESRDDINNIYLRAFSLFGLITVLSGFLLWFSSSATIRKLFKFKS